MQALTTMQNTRPQQTQQVTNRWRILTDIPYVRLVAVTVMALVVLIGFIRSLTSGSVTPLLFPVMATVLSAAAILAIDMKEIYGTTYMRIGFHAGILIFLTSFPILAPEILPIADETVRFTAGMALVLCVLGFEIGYWTLRSISGIAKPKSPYVLVANNYSWVHRLLFVGIAMYALYLIYAVASSGRSFFSTFFALRGAVTGNTEDIVINADANRDTIALLLSYGRYMAAAAATILILAPNPFRFATNKTIAWLALLGCAFIGMNNASGGSRSAFLLSSVPFLTTLWIYSGTIKSIRQFRPLLVILLLLVVLFGFQYLAANREMGTVQEDQVRFNVDKVDMFDTSSLSAFGIYSDYENVVGAFPEKVEFQNGASIVPIVLGWVPRRFWPEKPYPFTKIASELRGFGLYTTSIACGFPAEGYGNFGYPGVLLWGALMGLGCAFADFRMNNLRPGHPLALSMRGMMAVWAAIIVRGGTAEMFYTGAFPIGFMWICLYFSEPRQLKTT